MRKALWCAFLFSTVAFAGTVVTFNPSEIAPSTINDNDPFTNQWAAYGITGQDMYWYHDPRDTFDTYGVSLNAPMGSILLSAPTTLTIDYWTIEGHTTTYSVYDASNTLRDSFVVTAASTDVLGTFAFTGSDIVRLTLTGDAGYGQVSTLYYNASAVPEPSTVLLCAAGIGVTALIRLRRRS